MRQQWSLSRIDQHDSRYEGIGRHFAKLAGSIVPIVMGQHNNGTDGAPWRSLQPRDGGAAHILPRRRHRARAFHPAAAAHLRLS